MFDCGPGVSIDVFIVCIYCQDEYRGGTDEKCDEISSYLSVYGITLFQNSFPLTLTYEMISDDTSQ